jgi:hypothetical protein
MVLMVTPLLLARSVAIAQVRVAAIPPIQETSAARVRRVSGKLLFGHLQDRREGT